MLYLSHRTVSQQGDSLVAFVDIVELAKTQNVALTGSHYFGTTTSDSDYDFFTTNDSALSECLLNSGWHLVHSYAQDEETSTVLRRGSVHLQLVSDFDLKMEAQKYLHRLLSMPVHYLAFNSKPDNRQAVVLLWKLAYAYARAVRKAAYELGRRHKEKEIS